MQLKRTQLRKTSIKLIKEISREIYDNEQNS